MKCRANGLKECKCGAKGGDDLFYWRNTGKKKKDGTVYLVRSALCKKCHNRRAVSNRMNDRPRFLTHSMRCADKKAGHHFSMTLEFVRSVLRGPCTYCGDEVLPLTLDRKDNAIGHVEHNVVVSCIMCNAFRGNMPYDAWLVVAPALKKARLKGLLAGWSGQHSSKLVYPRS